MVLLALVVATVMGTLGFAAGFISHAALVEFGPDKWRSAAAATEPAQPSAQGPSPADTALPPEQPTIAPTAVTAPSGGEEESFALFWEAWRLVQRDYFGDLPNDEEMTYGAIRGVLATLDDPYTGFMSPEVARISREDDSGSFQGIGATVSMQEGRLIIVDTFRDSPAEKAGLRQDDVILKVDETSIENMSIYEAIALIRGPAGTELQLQIGREGADEPLLLTLVRAEIEIPTVEAALLEGDIGHVTLYEFSTDATAKMEEAIDDLVDQGAKSLILDLRGNPGGWLSEAVDTAGLFLPRDTVILLERFKDGTEQVYKVTRRPSEPDIPLVVLVDGGSASASEIVAGALQDHGRAVLIGEKTFGKGSVQLPHELSNGAELRVTIARWFTPNDRAIHGAGLDPDIVVELTAEDLEAERDPQLERAQEYLQTGR